MRRSGARPAREAKLLAVSLAVEMEMPGTRERAAASVCRQVVRTHPRLLEQARLDPIAIRV